MTEVKIMKNKIFNFVLSALIGLSGIFLVGCDLGNNPKKNYNEDIQAVLSQELTSELFVVEEDVTYYTSDALSLMMEVNGAFLAMDYFYLDGNKRVYDNMYFYEDDYFYMITDDYSDIFASLCDSNDTQYAEEEKEQGYDIQINVKKEGIYKLIFDVDTLKFDIEYKAEIDEPQYYRIKNCQIYSTVTTQWVDMAVNPNNADEFVINNFSIGVNESIAFFDRTHTSIYKITLDENCNEKYGSYRYPNVLVNVGGLYNVYINAKTYVVRLELINPNEATYTCVHYDGTNFITLEPNEVSVPYVFCKRIEVTTNYTSLPSFYTTKYATYDLAVVDNANVLMNSSSGNYYFKQIGTYELTINLKTFEISVELLPE